MARLKGAPKIFDKLFPNTVDTFEQHWVAMMLERADDLYLAVQLGDPEGIKNEATRYGATVELVEKKAKRAGKWR